MTREIRDQANRVLAVLNSAGEWKCVLCPTWLQRSVNGSITDGVRQHYRVVHPERKI